MSKSSLTIKRSRPVSNSSIATYMTFPVILKAIQVIVGIVCIWIAATDLLDNFVHLATLSAAVIANKEFNDVLHRIQEALKPIKDLNVSFIDQLGCRILYLTVTGIFLTISLIQLTWFPVSLFAGPLKSRIISGVVYHLIGFGLQLAASLKLRAKIDLLGPEFVNNSPMRVAVTIGIISAVLYLLSIVPALWSFRSKGLLHGNSSAGQRRMVLKDSLPKFETGGK